MFFLKYAILPRISVLHFAQRSVILPPMYDVLFSLRDNASCQLYISGFCLNQNSVKIWKESNNYIQPYLSVMRHNSSRKSTFQSSILPPKCQFSPDITFGYNAACQLCFRLWLNQDNVEYDIRGK